MYLEDSQLPFKMAFAYGVVVQGTRGWEIRVWASGEGCHNNFKDICGSDKQCI